MVHQCYHQNVVYVLIKNSRFKKEQEAKRLLSSLGLKTTLNKYLVAFCFNYKMNEIVNKLLLAGDRFMPEMHLKQTCFTYNVCGLFIKNKEKIKNLCRQETIDYNYRLYLQKLSW